MAVTQKISVTIGRKELGHAKRLASKLGVSLSGFITDAVRERVNEQERREAALEVLKSFGTEDRASPAEALELLARWAPGGDRAVEKPRTPRRRRSSRRRKR
jgi:hypothetical protein